MMALETDIFLTDTQNFMVKWTQHTCGIQLIPRNTKKDYETGCRKILMHNLWLSGMSKTKLSVIFGYHQPSTVAQLLNGYDDWMSSIKINRSNPYSETFIMIDNYLFKLLY